MATDTAADTAVNTPAQSRVQTILNPRKWLITIEDFNLVISTKIN